MQLLTLLQLSLTFQALTLEIIHYQQAAIILHLLITIAMIQSTTTPPIIKIFRFDFEADIIIFLSDGPIPFQLYDLFHFRSSNNRVV